MGSASGQADSAGQSEENEKYALGKHRRIQQRFDPRGSWKIPIWSTI